MSFCGRKHYLYFPTLCVCFLWVRKPCTARGLNECKMSWWSLKRLKAQGSHHITSICPGENTMTSIPLISLVLVAVMVQTASAQGKRNTDFKQVSLHSSCFLCLFNDLWQSSFTLVCFSFLKVASQPAVRNSPAQKFIEKY